ncbi:MAG: iron ABC transporter permease [Acidimicrobiia bacterium]|nr:iron ABC transporter permease [Acidimicrobiia bacterium]
MTTTGAAAMSGVWDRRISPVARHLVPIAIAVVFSGPAAFVLWRTFRLGALSESLDEIIDPLWRTIQLAVLVSATAAVIGTGLAWLTTRTDLPGRRFWRVVLILPLVLPSFVGAAAFIAGLAPGGIIHDALESIGIDAPRRFRGLGAAWLVLTAFTYPYVLLPVTARFANLPANLDESARMLGLSSTATFLRVTLPQLRPAILGGSLLVFLYTVSDFGAVQLLGYDTLTRVVYATRQTNRALSFAAASVVLILALAVVALERSQRGAAQPDRRATVRPMRPIRLGWRAMPALLACTVVAGIGLVVPVASLGTWAQRGLAEGRIGFGELIDPTISTASVSVIAAVVAVGVVLPVAIATTRRPSPSSQAAAVAVIGGFAIPGLVLALALAVLTLNTPALSRWYQTLPVLIGAYVIHFGSQALASSESAVRAVPANLRESGRLLEPRRGRRWFHVDLPLMRPGLVAGGGLVMLATLKELPATLLLSPIGFSTLATEIWASYEEGFYAATGLASLVLIMLSALLTWALVLRRSDVIRS